MIDIWFLLLLILIVLTIIFHTAIAFLLGPYNQPFMKMDGTTDQVEPWTVLGRRALHYMRKDSLEI